MRKILLSIVVLLFSSNVFAANVEIVMLNKNKETKQRMVYSEELIKIETGDTIDWVLGDKGHNVEMLAGPEGYELPKKSKLSKPVSITFDKPGIYLYQCSPHAAFGMIGIIVVGGDTSNLDAISESKTLTGKKAKKKRKKLLKELG